MEKWVIIIMETLVTQYENDKIFMESSQGFMTRREIDNIAVKNRWLISIPENLMADDNISIYTKVTVQCSKGHCWNVMIGNIHDRCAICKILLPMNRIDPDIKCMQESYDYGQCKFEFICSYGHKFISDARTASTGSSRRPKIVCKSCKLLAIARKKHGVDKALIMDTKCIYAHNNSRLRFHCNKLRHNPNCTNPPCVNIRECRAATNRDFAAGCTNMIICNQDFYATPDQLKRFDSGAGVYSCVHDHYVTNHALTCVRLFEILFDTRFDDMYPDGISFTGYNSSLKIAFTHSDDKISRKCTRTSREWCEKNGVVFMYIDQNTITGGKTSRMLSMIVNYLYDKGVFSGIEGFSGKSAPSIIRETSTRRGKMNDNHKLFDDRCI